MVRFGARAPRIRLSEPVIFLGGADMSSARSSYGLVGRFSILAICVLGCSPGDVTDKKNTGTEMTAAKVSNLACNISSRGKTVSVAVTEARNAQELLSHLLALKRTDKVNIDVPLAPEHILEFTQENGKERTYSLYYYEVLHLVAIYTPTSVIGPFEVDDRLHDRIVQVIESYARPQQQSKDR
jgi:hypothetical protein